MIIISKVIKDNKYFSKKHNFLSKCPQVTKFKIKAISKETLVQYKVKLLGKRFSSSLLLEKP